MGNLRNGQSLKQRRRVGMTSSVETLFGRDEYAARGEVPPKGKTGNSCQQPR